jgi:hypothetical protein
MLLVSLRRGDEVDIPRSFLSWSWSRYLKMVIFNLYFAD